MALQADTIATAIAGLTVSGVSIKDLDEIPESVAGRDCPLLYPKPDGFMSNLRVERDAFGPASMAPKTARYTLTYTYLHAPVSGGRGLFDVYQALVSNTLLILDQIIANDTVSGAVTLEPVDVIEFGPVHDPAGEWFHGATIRLACVEFIN